MRIKIKDYYKKGFSLNEILLVVFIIVIMSAVSIAVLWENKERKEVETAAREVVAALREAQSYALTGKGAKPLCGTGYSFSVPSDNIYEITLSGSDSSCSGTVLASYKLRNKVVFTAGPTTTFSIPHGSISGNSLYKISKGSTVYSVCVCTSGKIEEIDHSIGDCSTIC